MPFDPISMVLGAVGSGVNIVQGLNQQSQGERMAASNKRPVYDIPSEVDQSTDNIRSLMSTELPGASVLRARASGNTANTVAAAKEVASTPGQILGALGRANTVEQNTDADIGIAGGNQYLNEAEAYRRALLTKAGYKDKAFEYNKDKPYQARAAAASALIGAGTKNVNSGIQDLLSSFGNVGNELDASGVLRTQPGAPRPPQQRVSIPFQQTPPIQQAPMGLPPLDTYPPYANESPDILGEN